MSQSSYSKGSIFFMIILLTSIVWAVIFAATNGFGMKDDKGTPITLSAGVTYTILSIVSDEDRTDVGIPNDIVFMVVVEESGDVPLFARIPKSEILGDPPALGKSVLKFKIQRYEKTSGSVITVYVIGDKEEVERFPGTAP